MKRGAERTIGVVPRPVTALLAIALCLQIGWQALRPGPSARPEALDSPPSPAALRVMTFGEPVALAQALTLYLQAFDNQPGVSIPFLDLDYARVAGWLGSILALDPVGQYPLLMASRVYSQVPDAAKQRGMCDFVRRAFEADPDRRWRWLAHCAIVAKHRLGDPGLALAYADAITQQARAASSWARQMRIFMLEDLGEVEAATILLGGLLESGEVTDPREIHFLTTQLERMKAVGKSSRPSESRHPRS